MSLLDDKGGGEQAERPMVRGWVVGGTTFTNSAAMFWVGLLNEVARAYPQCTSMELAAGCPGRLKDECRWPEKAFERDLDALASTDLGTVLREAVAEMELLGGPTPIALRVYEGENERRCGAIPLDCADAEIFPYLVAWMLFWADLPERVWNREIMNGELRASGIDDGGDYALGLELRNRHLSEDLYERVLVVQMSR
jgi:hypothetical protein